MCFPSFPAFSRPAVRRRPTTRTSRSPSCRPTTTGTSTSGAAPTPAASSRWRCPCCGTPSSRAAEVRRVAAKGCHSLTFTENPATLGYPSFHDDALGPAVAGARRRRARSLVDPPRLVGPARGHRARRADRRDDHAAADEHLPGRGRPRCGRGSSRSSPTSRSRCPRAAPAGSRTSSTASTAPTTCTTCGPARTSATSCRARCSASTSSPASSPTRSASSCATTSASTTSCWEQRLPALRLVVAERARGARAVVGAYGVPDDELDKITHENAMRWYRFDPFAHRAEGAVHGRRAAGRGRRATTSSIRGDGQGPLRDGAARARPRRARGEGDRVDGGTEPARAPAPATSAAEPLADPRRGRGGVRAQRLPRRDRQGDRDGRRVLGRRRLQLLRRQGRPVRPDLPAPGRGVHGGDARGPRRARPAARGVAPTRRLPGRVLPDPRELRALVPPPRPASRSASS